jgi:hypothetical protein
MLDLRFFKRSRGQLLGPGDEFIEAEGHRVAELQSGIGGECLSCGKARCGTEGSGNLQEVTAVEHER